MKRFVKAAGMTAASCALVVSGAGVAAATPDEGQTKGRYVVTYKKAPKKAKKRHHHHDHGKGASASGVAVGSPGFLSGNVIQVPINVPINACGNQVPVIALLNFAHSGKCINK
ncbi:chaplin [Streptomyces sp. P1-3]|uniref:chaplin n=1 Tax=Streptomyces sp. P1-3 TaxID=3421658 RepID=UPI003D36F076